MRDIRHQGLTVNHDRCAAVPAKGRAHDQPWIRMDVTKRPAEGKDLAPLARLAMAGADLTRPRRPLSFPLRKQGIADGETEEARHRSFDRSVWEPLPQYREQCSLPVSGRP